MLCPSDSYNRQPLNGSKCPSQTSALGDGWARGNYAASAGLGYTYGHPYTGDCGVPVCMAAEDLVAWNDYRVRGVMGVNKAVNLAQITD